MLLDWKTKAKKTHSENLLNSQNALHKDGAQLVSDSRQQKPEEGDAKYGIKNAKDLSTLRSGRYVSITCCRDMKGKDSMSEESFKYKGRAGLMWGGGLGGEAIKRNMRSRRQPRFSYAT